MTNNMSSNDYTNNDDKPLSLDDVDKEEFYDIITKLVYQSLFININNEEDTQIWEESFNIILNNYNNEQIKYIFSIVIRTLAVAVDKTPLQKLTRKQILAHIKSQLKNHMKWMRDNQ